MASRVVACQERSSLLSERGEYVEIVLVADAGGCCWDATRQAAAQVGKGSKVQLRCVNDCGVLVLVWRLPLPSWVGRLPNRLGESVKVCRMREAAGREYITACYAARSYPSIRLSATPAMHT